MLQNLTPEHVWFTVMDLANGFLSIPLPDEVTPIFAFMHLCSRVNIKSTTDYHRVIRPWHFQSVFIKNMLGDSHSLRQYVDDMYIDD